MRVYASLQMSFKRTKTGTEREYKSVNATAVPTSKTETASQTREPASYKYYSSADLKGLARPRGRAVQPLNELLKPDRMPNVRAEWQNKEETRSHAACHGQVKSALASQPSHGRGTWKPCCPVDLTRLHLRPRTMRIVALPRRKQCTCGRTLVP